MRPADATPAALAAAGLKRVRGRPARYRRHQPRRRPPLSAEERAWARDQVAAGAGLEAVATALGVTEACVCRHARGLRPVSIGAQRARLHARRHGVDVPLALTDAYLAYRRASPGLTPAEALNCVHRDLSRQETARA